MKTPIKLGTLLDDYLDAQFKTPFPGRDADKRERDAFTVRMRGLEERQGYIECMIDHYGEDQLVFVDDHGFISTTDTYEEPAIRIIGR